MPIERQAGSIDKLKQKQWRYEGGMALSIIGIILFATLAITGATGPAGLALAAICAFITIKCADTRLKTIASISTMHTQKGRTENLLHNPAKANTMAQNTPQKSEPNNLEAKTLQELKQMLERALTESESTYVTNIEKIEKFIQKNDSNLPPEIFKRLEIVNMLRKTEGMTEDDVAKRKAALLLGFTMQRLTAQTQKPGSAK